jgi:hypothetical protein
MMEKGRIVDESLSAHDVTGALVLQAIWGGVQEGMAHVQLGENRLQTPLLTPAMETFNMGQTVKIRMLSKTTFEVLG